MSSTGPSVRAAVRVVNQSSCGSGSICGHYQGGSLILTNAHVAGTQIGRNVVFDAVVDGQRVRKDARVIQAAYSNRTQTDWAVLMCENWQAIEPVYLSKKVPTGSHYTQGSPRCVWPQRNTDITTVDQSPNSPLWRWTPNAIGGQSGSGVWSDTDNLQYGLLTWSWGGYGAGQMTAWIYKQARTMTTFGLPRVDGLVELPDESDETNVDRTGADDPVVGEGFFTETGITDLPIWAEDNPGGGGGGGGNGGGGGSQEPDSLAEQMISFFRDLEEVAEKHRLILEAGESPGCNDPEPNGKIFGL
jgi:hypothetical protein